MRVRIKKLGNLNKAAYGGQQPDGALDIIPSAWGGGDLRGAQEGVQVQRTLTSEPREEANLEAEGGETAFGPISGDTIPDHMVIKGPRHTNGGVPLNLPDDTFIFSDTKRMKISDPNILAMFGKKKKKGGYTPAELAKPYDIQKYKAILMDPKSDQKDIDTAQMMIQNYVLKLGALALAQEAKKGFPQGIPEMARPYMEENGISEEQLLPQQPQQEMPQEQMPPMEQMPMQPPMAFGGFSDLDKFVTGGFDPTLAFNDGTVQGATAADRLENAIYSEENLDNLSREQLQARNEELLANDPVSQQEFTPPPPPTPEEIASGEGEQDPVTGGKASYKWKNKFEVNKPELARRANMALQIGANLINEYDRRRIAARSERASYDEPARRKDSRGMYGANTGREALRNMEEAEMIVGQDYGQYGGSMADYAMSMGGAYFPTMSTGGFNMLPKAQKGDGGKKKSRSKTKEELQAGLDTATIQNVEKVPDDAIYIGEKDGASVYAKGNILYSEGRDLDRSNIGSGKWKGTDADYSKNICNEMQNGAYKNVTAKEMAAEGIISKERIKEFQACENLEVVKGDGQGDDYFTLVEEKQMCDCKDEDGNLLPAEEQPEPIVNEETGEVSCPCPGETTTTTTTTTTTEEQPAYVDDPHWSDVATRGVYTAATMDPGVDRPQLRLPDKVETRPVYEDYLAKVQAIQAGLSTAADAASKTAGSTGDKMAMLSQLVGQASPAAANAVAETQARIVGYQDAANARKFQGDVAYANTVADIMGRQAMLDADAANTYRTNRNVKAANVQEQIQLAEDEMVKRQNLNTMYPQYASEYHKGFIYPTGRGRTPVPEKPVGIEDYAAMLAQAKQAFQDDELARKYVEAQMGISRYGGEFAKGGYVMGSNVFPFMFY